MKRIFILICILSLLCTTTFAYVIAEPDTDSNNVVIKGSEQSDEIMVTIAKMGKSVAEADNAIKNNLDINDYVFYIKQFAVNGESYRKNVLFADDAPGGIYEMTTGKEAAKISFSPLTNRIMLISQMNTQVTEIGGFQSFIAENYDKIGININMYEKCTNKTKALDIAFDALSVRTATLKETVNAINCAFLTELLNEGETLDFEYMTNAVVFSNQEQIVTWKSLITYDGTNKIMERLRNQNFSSFSDLESNLLRQMVICEITYPVNPDASKLSEALILKNTYLGLKLADFLALSMQHRAEVINKIKNDKPITLADLQEMLNQYVKAYTLMPDSPSGGKSNFNKVDIGMDENTNNTADNIGLNSFSDLGGYLWAANYINMLSEMKIVSGYEDNTFRPEADVSRAEFTTMVARHMYKSFTDDCEFDDVAKEYWAYKFIATALVNGIINGNGELFMPADAITREDVAVILYRSIIKNGIAHDLMQNSDIFIDDSNISDYARDAVYALKELGIINGNEMGEFKPLERATRAEAAKMIYLFIKLPLGDRI